jgi:pentatricopeptide repeat protein
MFYLTCFIGSDMINGNIISGRKQKERGMSKVLSGAIAVLFLVGLAGACLPAGQLVDTGGTKKESTSPSVLCPLEQMGVTCPCGESCPDNKGQEPCGVCASKAGRMAAAALEWRSAMQAKDYDRALEAVRQMDAAVPDNSNIKASFALVYNLRGEYDKALAVYQDMLNDFPDNPTVIGNIANVYLLKGEYEQALVIYNRLAERYPEEPSILNALAAAYLKNGNLDKAISVYERILLVRSDDYAVLYNICCAYALNGVNDKAGQYLNKAVECGYYDWRHIEDDSDLDGIRNGLNYKQTVEVLKARYPDSAKPKGAK